MGQADGLSGIPIVNQVTTSQNKENLDEPDKTKLIKLVIVSKGKTHSHTAFHPASKWLQVMPEVLSASYRTTYQRALTLHFLFNK